MNGGERYNAEKVNQFLSEGVRERTILFLDTYSGAVYGNALALFQQALEDERFYDWTIRWTVPDPDEVQDDLRGERRDSRVELVRAGSVGFLHAMETSQIIVSGARLPRYYIKNKGQVVVSVLPTSDFLPESTINKKRSLVQQTLCKVDLLYLEDGEALQALRMWYPTGTPFRIVEGAPLRHAARPVASGDVVLSLSKTALGKTYADMERRFKAIDMICVEHGKSLHMRIPHEKWMAYREENAPEVLDRVGDDSNPIVQELHSAQILVTDRLEEVKECMTTACSCIFFSNQIGELYELYVDNKERLIFAGNWDEVCEKFQELLSGGIPTASNAVGWEAARAGFDQLLSEALQACAGPVVTRPPFQRGELFVLLAALDDNVLRALEYYKPGKDVSVLFTTVKNPGIWNGHRLHERIGFTAKMGVCVPNEEGQYTEQILRNEWRRLLGDCEYETIYAKTTEDEFWQAMYQCAPAREVVMISRKKVLGAILDQADSSPLLCSRSAADESPEEVRVGDTLCYVIGRKDRETYYLESRGPWERPALVFANSKAERELVKGYLARCKKRTVFLMDPTGCMKESEFLEKNNIFWLPIKELPVKLLLYAETVVQCQDLAVREIAVRMGKRVKWLGDEPKPTRASKRWALLSTQSEDEML